jgi:UDPglucose--hexose-1-phosphate uridylyltransferase
MPELRKDPILGRWVVIGTERVRRPADFHAGRPHQATTTCVLCEGNEHETPPELLAYRDGLDSVPNGPGWQVRVVPSKFPILRIEGDIERRGHGLYDVMNGIGAHEVIVESPRHRESLTRLPLAGVEQVLRAYRERMLDLKRDDRIRSVTVFKKHGLDLGATREHGYSQLLGTPTPPQRLSDELHHARAYYDYRERCLLCDIVRQETEERTRVVEGSDQIIAFAPFASRFPFEVWILPRQHAPAFEQVSPTDLRALARVLHTVLRKLDVALEDPPFNLVLHSAPAGEHESPYCHWHIEIAPKLTPSAGSEWGSGFHVNPMPPEDAARFLRDAPA